MSWPTQQLVSVCENAPSAASRPLCSKPSPSTRLLRLLGHDFPFDSRQERLVTGDLEVCLLTAHRRPISVQPRRTAAEGQEGRFRLRDFLVNKAQRYITLTLLLCGQIARIGNFLVQYQPIATRVEIVCYWACAAENK